MCEVGELTTTPNQDEPSYSQAVHVHGEAVLLVVTEAGQVQVRLESPAESVIGFEHPPRTTQEWQRAATAIAALSAHNVLVAGDPDGPCKRMEMTWSTPLFSASALANPPAKSNPTGREIGHAEETHHHDGDVSANEVAQDAAVPAKVEGHSGIEATWRFSCGGTPEWLEQRLLSTFPDLERLEVQLATAHYVTGDLDEGPIIEQDVRRIDHRFAAHEMESLGRDIEAVVLARAVRMHVEGRVFIDDNKTVFFG